MTFYWLEFYHLSVRHSIVARATSKAGGKEGKWTGGVKSTKFGKRVGDDQHFFTKLVHSRCSHDSDVITDF